MKQTDITAATGSRDGLLTTAALENSDETLNEFWSSDSWGKAKVLEVQKNF